MSTDTYVHTVGEGGTQVLRLVLQLTNIIIIADTIMMATQRYTVSQLLPLLLMATSSSLQLCLATKVLREGGVAAQRSVSSAATRNEDVVPYLFPEFQYKDTVSNVSDGRGHRASGERKQEKEEEIIKYYKKL